MTESDNSKAYKQAEILLFMEIINQLLLPVCAKKNHLIFHLEKPLVKHFFPLWSLEIILKTWFFLNLNNNNNNNKHSDFFFFEVWFNLFHTTLWLCLTLKRKMHKNSPNPLVLVVGHSSGVIWKATCSTSEAQRRIWSAVCPAGQGYL